LKNSEIRQFAKEKGVLLWQIAEKLGVTDGNFSRKLRHEFEAEQKQKITQIIVEISEGKR